MKIHLCSTLFFGITLFAFNCQKNQKLSADEIIAKSIENINAPLLNQAEVRFKFREQEVSYRNYNGTFHHQRTFQDTSGNMIHDELTNSSFTRSVNGEELNLSEEEQTNLSGGLNSIIYFAFLPYRLQDPSVNAELMGKVSIKGKDYHKIKVTFDQEGGGEDFEDIFLYYFEFSDYSLDYLAYAYHVHGGGIRFRVAQPISEETEVKMQNYVNYKPKGDIDFLNIEEAYENDQLMELSKIELYDIEIKKLN